MRNRHSRTAGNFYFITLCSHYTSHIYVISFIPRVALVLYSYYFASTRSFSFAALAPARIPSPSIPINSIQPADARVYTIYILHIYVVSSRRIVSISISRNFRARLSRRLPLPTFPLAHTLSSYLSAMRRGFHVVVRLKRRRQGGGTTDRERDTPLSLIFPPRR